MKKNILAGKSFGILFAIVLIGAMLPLGALVNHSQALAQEPKTWYVDDDLVDYPAADFTKIQEASDAASPGDSIIVYPGAYTENIDINKDHLTIRSENGAEVTIVKAANSDDPVFEITADYVTMDGFTVKGGWIGIYFNGTPSDNIKGCKISQNIVSNNTAAVSLHFSSNNTLASNTASNNRAGIYLAQSSSNTLINNMMLNNQYNFDVEGGWLSTFIQEVDTSNTVNGKPIYYWVGEQNRQVPSDAGYVGIIDCNNITVKDLTLTHNCKGLLLAYSDNLRIENVSLLNNQMAGREGLEPTTP